MKGKKFDAHEKHFKEKEIKLHQTINILKRSYKEIRERNVLLTKENKILKEENLSIKAKYEKLLEYAKLSENDIKEALEKDRSLNQLATLFSVMPNIGNY